MLAKAPNVRNGWKADIRSRSNRLRGAWLSLKNSEQLAWQAMEEGNYDEAVRLLTPLAHRNSEFALLSLGWIYEQAPPQRRIRTQRSHSTPAPRRKAALRAPLILVVFSWTEGRKRRPGQRSEQVRKKATCRRCLNSDGCCWKVVEVRATLKTAGIGSNEQQNRAIFLLRERFWLSKMTVRGPSRRSCPSN